jgi:hypothetical protein
LCEDKDLAQSCEIASQHPSPAWQLGGLPDEADVVTIPEGLSRFEQAVMLASHLDFIAPTDLLEHNIANSKTVATQTLSQLRDAGVIGQYDRTRKASPTNPQPTAPTATQSGEGWLASGSPSGESASHTGKVRNVRLNMPRFGEVN